MSVIRSTRTWIYLTVTAGIALLVLQTYTLGVSGSGAYTFNGICDVAVADNGDIFVADGHFNNRVVKYSADGEFVKSWGQPGTGPSEFDMPHSIDIDSQGRVFVADSQSVDGVNPDFEMGIYYGSAADGSVDTHIGDIWTESVTENTDGNLFSGLVEHRGLVRYEAE